MKLGDRIHLNGCPNKQGTIIEDIGFDKFFGDELMKIKWDTGKTHNNHIKTLCQCRDGKCQVS